MSASEISLLKSNQYGEKCKNIVETSIDLIGGMKKIVQKGDTVLIKPNLVNGYDGLSGNVTHFSLVDQLIKMCVDSGAKKIFVGDGSGNAETPNALRAAGMDKVIERYTNENVPVKFVDLNFDKNPDTDDYDIVDLGDDALNQNHIYRVAHSVLNSDVFISVPKLKVHPGSGITISLKNVIGIAPGGYYGFPKKGGTIKSIYHGSIQRRNVLPHGSQEKKYDLLWRTIIDLNRIVLGDYKGSPKKRKYLSVVDGVIAGAYNDLYSTWELPLWKTITLGVIIAGTDPVAVDTIASRVICLNPFKIPMIIKASKENLGSMYNIMVHGEKIENIRQYIPPDNDWLFTSDFQLPRIWPSYLYRLVRKYVLKLVLHPTILPTVKKIRAYSRKVSE